MTTIVKVCTTSPPRVYSTVMPVPARPVAGALPLWMVMPEEGVSPLCTSAVVVPSGMRRSQPSRMT